MATFTKLPSGSWRAQGRRKGRHPNETFVRSDDAKRGARETECRVDRGEAPTSARARRVASFGDLIDLHIADTCEVGQGVASRDVV